jgi:hypothetical protein
MSAFLHRRHRRVTDGGSCRANLRCQALGGCRDRRKGHAQAAARAQTVRDPRSVSEGFSPKTER